MGNSESRGKIPPRSNDYKKNSLTNNQSESVVAVPIPAHEFHNPSPSDHHFNPPATTILTLSRIVWEQAVVPWLLQPAKFIGYYTWDLLPRPATVSCVLATAEAMFPLVALASRAVLLLHSKSHCGSRRYAAIEAAAGVLSPRCVAWLIRNKSSRVMGSCCWWETEGDTCVGVTGDRNALLLPLTSSPAGGGDGTDTDTEMERENQGRRRKAKEQVAVLRGLCVGGHLKMAQRFVENGCECWCEEGGETSGSSSSTHAKKWGLWPPSSGSFGDNSILGRSSDSVVGVTTHDELSSSSLLDLSTVGSNWGDTLFDEFWGKRGVFHIMEEVSRNGHLDVLKWLVLNCVKEINEGNKTLLRGCLCEAILDGHLHILKWLVGTFNLDQLVSRLGLECSFYPLKGRVSDVKLFVETFPHWNFSEAQNLVASAATCKGCSADEIIEVCKWLKDRFSLNSSAFLPPIMRSRLPKNPKVIQWALSSDGVTERATLEGWHRTCMGIGDVELGKWVVEENCVTATITSFMAACSGSHDSVEFLEWLFQKVGWCLHPDYLVEALHRALVARNHCIARWLEQHITTTTGSRPKVLLSKLPWRDVPITQEDWLEWVLLTHSRYCDIDCSPAEVLNVVKASVKGDFAVSTKISRAVSVWKRFPLSPQQVVENHDLLVTLLKKGVEVGSFHELKRVLSVGDFTVDDMMQCFGYRNPRSTKITKWFVSSVCTITRGRASACSDKSHEYTDHSLVPAFLWMLSQNKRGCAEWLFHKLKLTLPAVISELENRGRLLGASVDIATWKLILKLFPDITRDVAIKYFMQIHQSWNHT
ncbi:hypothetical protein Pelo_18416 [Pelomyxa schiedti]|nr:hypothetical protein Pelo_18416 [Pelomyxa schiedti]